MKFAFFINERKDVHFLGDLRAIEVIKDGLENFGHEVVISSDLPEVIDADHLFLSNVSYDLLPKYNLLTLLKKKYYLLSFHEDFAKWSPTCHSFEHHVKQALSNRALLDQLIHNPSVLDKYIFPPFCNAKINKKVIEGAEICFANSYTEQRTILRDCPKANTDVIFLSSGQITQNDYAYSDVFLKLTGLCKKEYILQVGRFHPKKNQLGSILASRNLNTPLVFIATNVSDFKYAKLCMDAANKWRKAKTIIITKDQLLSSHTNVEIIPIIKETEMSTQMIVSAFQNAGLHLHPSFQELPGYTYLEAARLGIPSVGSSWTSIHDYFLDSNRNYTLDDRIQTFLPHHIQDLEDGIKRMLGKEYSLSNHSIFQIDAHSIAKSLLNAIYQKQTQS